MSTSFFNRKKEKDDNDEPNEEETTPLNQDPEEASPKEGETETPIKVFTTPTKCSQLTNRVKNMGTFNILLISNIICFFLFIIALPAAEKARHYKVVHDAISDLTKQVKAQTDSLTSQQTELTNKINDESDTLIEKMYDLLGVVSAEHHEKEVGEKDTHIKLKQSEIEKKQIEIEKLKQSIDRHKADLNDVRSKLGKTQSKVDNFCDTCAYRAEKVITSCYRKMQYIMKHSHHLTTEYEAKAAVIELDPKCSREPSD